MAVRLWRWCCRRHGAARAAGLGIIALHRSTASPRDWDRSPQLLSFQPAHHFVELIEAAIADRQRTATAAVVDTNREPERIGQAFFQRQRIGVFRRTGLVAGFLLPAFLLTGLAGDLFDLARVEAARDYFVRQALRVVMTH